MDRETRHLRREFNRSVVAAVARSVLAGPSLEDQIVAKEREELNCLRSGSLEQFAALLAEDAVFVDAHGPAAKTEIVKHSAEFRLADYSMEGVRFVPASADSGLITYKITENGVSHGRQFTATLYVSALWARRTGKWVCLFSQETAAAK
jgi:hypothetical protein